ncbi:ribose-5-phosphate isomerase [Tessaracoccus sp. OH4464_COT-324]|uniref:ribose-5-phosphate isomerase n=1 Tax=Tessaracoccus sp. OH4464_COT-324 TaxID=2491059 RepID=UPI000F63DD41|nr:ribose-5-phosphate isomerase [Tessaracoccus sp. OH4464_COT-324]RRD46874.1 ribose-5-phosphate isomerase [Tessaracoccus sp. OH4464_COT-324]
MRVHIATDHAAFEVKNYLVERLQEAGHDVVDHGAHVYDAADDYPTFIIPCAEAVAAESALGVVLGGSGNGEQIAANKVRGIRAALAYNTELARLAREHNNANILSLGGRMQPQEEAWAMVETFLATEYTGEERHQRRIDAISAYEG